MALDKTTGTDDSPPDGTVQFRCIKTQPRVNSASPSVGLRVFAVVLVLVVSPGLLLLGAFTAAFGAGTITAIALGLFAFLATICWQGAGALWRGELSLWTFALVLVALLSIVVYASASQPLGWHN